MDPAQRFRLPLLALCLLLSSVMPARADRVTWLDTADLRGMRQDWGTPQRSRSVMGNPLTVAGRRFARGIGTHARSRLVLPVAGYTRFSALVGVDDEMQGHPGSVEFMVSGDGRLLWRSGVMRVGTPPKPVAVSLAGVRLLELTAADGGDGIDSDHADWCDARLSGGSGRVGPAVLFLPSAVLEPASAQPGYNALRWDRNAAGQPFRVGGRPFASGIGMQAGANLTYTGLNGRYARFETWIGLDSSATGEGGARFKVFVDGRLRYSGPVMRKETTAARVSVSLAGAQELRLVTEAVSAPEGGIPSVWGEPALISVPAPAKTPERATRYTVRSPALTLELTVEGEIAGIVLPGGKHNRCGLTGGTRLAGCRGTGTVGTRALPNGGREFHRRLADPVTGAGCLLIERFTPTRSSIRWVIEIRGTGKPWSAAIETRLRWPGAAKARLWTAWADRRHAMATGWSDPLQTAPFQAMHLWYGAPPYREDNPRLGYVPFLYDIFCIPLVTVLDAGTGTGLSLVASPEDDLLELALTADADGSLALQRNNHRIQAARPVRFALDMVPHAPDWRAGLAWMAARYPAFFNPPNPMACEIAGCGAYSTWQGDLDLEKMRHMAFRVNWQASFEFPYMGMFLPPIDDEEAWTNFRRTITTIRGIEDYYRRMRALDFYVLSYFNVTEFGAYLRWPPPPRRAQSDEDLWRDANDYTWQVLGDAVLKNRQGQPFGSWEGAVAMDLGEPVYRQFLLGQIRRHLERTPSTAGFCIDRMDWLRLYNLERDDGVSWFEDKPARSLLMSWKGLMQTLGPMVHRAGKVVYVNNHIKRLETLRQADGLYDEFGFHPASMNLCALLGIYKPVLAWTASPEDLKPDPDAFFQRYLHLGIFPTAPYPGNDHSIQPDPWAERWYMDYGPMLDMLRGKRWALRPRAVEATGGAAKVNLFETPRGLVIPVTFGGKSARAIVVVRSPLPKGKLVCEALYPGETEPVMLRAAAIPGGLRLVVPLRRGCAMVRIRSAER